MRLFFLLILSHLLTDFIFQGKGLAQRKKESYSALTGHSLVFLVCSFVLLALFYPQTISINLIAILLVLTAVHFLLDSFKNYLEVKFPRRRLEWLTLDQVIHAGAIFSAWAYLYPTSIPNFINLIKARDFTDRFILITIGYMLMWGGTDFVKRILEKIPPIKEGEAEFNIGLVIGILERFLIFTLVLVDQYAVIGLVLAAKSIARFEDLKKRDFAEYYLIGTLMSSLIAVVTGILLKLLI